MHLKRVVKRKARNRGFNERFKICCLREIPLIFPAQTAVLAYSGRYRIFWPIAILLSALRCLCVCVVLFLLSFFQLWIRTQLNLLCKVFSCHRETFGVQCLAQGHFDTWKGQGLSCQHSVISGQPALQTEPKPPPVFV